MKDLYPKTEAMKRTLAVLHPELFSLENPVPLRKGIHYDLKARYPEMKWVMIHLLLGWLTRRRAYLFKMKEGSPRYGFDGPDGVVTAKDAAFAAKRFHERNDKAKDKWVLADDLPGREEHGGRLRLCQDA